MIANIKIYAFTEMFFVWILILMCYKSFPDENSVFNIYTKSMELFSIKNINYNKN